MMNRFFALIGACLLFAQPALMAGETPRYIFFNIAPSSAWNQHHPDTFTRKMFDEVKDTLQTAENPRLRVGLSFVFNTLDGHTNSLTQSLRRFLALSEETGIPVLVTLDGQNWWNHRPDLWNWWDTNRPGYNPSNVFNVEWTGWSPTNAVKICWRNWGQQFRVVPAPNIASPTVIQEHEKALRALVPVIVEWQRSLPKDRKWLFGGVKLGWEAGIGYNAYHYTNGNSYLDADPANDPQVSLAPRKGLSGGVAQLGYAAVKSAGIKSAGEITRDDIGEVTRRYLEQLCKVANQLGLPRELTFTHQGGNYDPWDKHLPFWPAFNKWSVPGWSFYATDPHEAGALDSEMRRRGAKEWAAAEWWWGASNAADWEDHFRRTLDFHDCRFICVYNWNQKMFVDDANAHEAVRNLVKNWKR